MYEEFLNKPNDDKRSANQIALTSLLTQKLTQLNLKRINSSSKQRANNYAGNLQQPIIQKEVKSQQNKILFICISGVPQFPGQFQNFTFPGEVIKYALPGFQFGLTQQQRRQRALKSDLNICADQLKEKIDQYPSDFSIVFVCHSYGTYIASYFFKNHFEKLKDRIRGIIELGGGPIRLYKVFEAFLIPISSLSRQFIIENIDYIYGQFMKGFEKTGNTSVPIGAYSSKYHIMSSSLGAKTEKFNQLFELNKKMPKVLKLFIYGEKDYIFDKGNSDEKSIHILYHPDSQLDSDYENKLKEKYQKIYNQPANKIQQKFIYKLSQGKHSLHIQKQLTPLIQRMIDDYLQIIL